MTLQIMKKTTLVMSHSSGNKNLAHWASLECVATVTFRETIPDSIIPTTLLINTVPDLTSPWRTNRYYTSALDP